MRKTIILLLITIGCSDKAEKPSKIEKQQNLSEEAQPWEVCNLDTKGFTSAQKDNIRNTPNLVGVDLVASGLVNDVRKHTLGENYYYLWLESATTKVETTSHMFFIKVIGIGKEEAMTINMKEKVIVSGKYISNCKIFDDEIFDRNKTFYIEILFDSLKRN